MNLPKTMLLFDYLRVDEKMTLKQECLLGFPKSPREVERLILESIEEIEKFKHHAEIGCATEKWFESNHFNAYSGETCPLIVTHRNGDIFDSIESIQELLNWAKEDQIKK